MATDTEDLAPRKREREEARSEARSEPPKKRKEVEVGRQIYMGNLDFRTEKSFLEKELSRFGEVTDIFMPLDNRGQPRGFAFVTFTEKQAASEAAATLDGRDFDGRTIKCNVARPRPNGGPENSRNSLRRRNNERNYKDERQRRQGRIFISGLPDDIRERELEDLYHRCGRIEYIELRKSRSTGRVEGVVVFEDLRDAEYACKETDGMRFERE